MSKSTFTQQYEEAMAQFRSGAKPTATPEQKPNDVTLRPPTAPKSMFKELAAPVPDTWKKFSEVFGFAPPSGNDRPGPVYQAEEFPDVLRPFIPKKKDGYFLDPVSVEALWHAHIDSDIVWLWGMSGTGKSSLEQEFCAYIGQPFLRFNGREDVESGALFGQLTVSGEGTEWVDGLLTEGVRYGARVLMDEATVIAPGIMMGLQWLLERDGKLMLTDKPAEAGDRLVEPDPRFRLTFADNTRGQGDTNGAFSGTGVMNTATLNRVGLTLEIKFLNPDQEFTVLKNKFGDRIEDELLAKTTKLAALLRRALAEEQLSLSFSLRTVESFLNKAYNYRTKPDGTELAFYQSYGALLPSDDEYQAARNFYNMVFN